MSKKFFRLKPVKEIPIEAFLCLMASEIQSYEIVFYSIQDDWLCLTSEDESFETIDKDAELDRLNQVIQRCLKA
ncbi:MAG: hypothetical protein OHK0046_11130 [Anaerolineae bacterium]